MGAVNSNQFLPQAQAFYAYYHRLALGRAAACKTMNDRIAARGGQASTFASFLDACRQIWARHGAFRVQREFSKVERTGGAW
jgi:hypothetical protein